MAKSDFFGWTKFFLFAGILSAALVSLRMLPAPLEVGIFVGALVWITAPLFYALVGAISYPLAVFINKTFPSVKGLWLMLLASSLTLAILATLLIPSILTTIIVFLLVLLSMLIPLGLLTLIYWLMKKQLPVV